MAHPGLCGHPFVTSCALAVSVTFTPGARASRQLQRNVHDPLSVSDERGITVEGLAEEGGRRQYSCPARFVRMGNSCYFMSTLMAPWHEAHFRCRSMGAHLAAFEKRWENRNMRKFLMREELGTHCESEKFSLVNACVELGKRKSLNFPPTKNSSGRPCL